MIIPKHLFADYKGAKSREAPTNLKPVGTGPYKFVDFKPGDMVKGEHQSRTTTSPTARYFDTIEMKGGGDAVSAARAVIQTGEYDYAWNMQVEDEILQRLEKGGKGTADIIARRQHRAHPAQQHRSLDRGRRRALEHQDQASAALPIPPCARPSACWSIAARCEEHIYGRTGIATANFLNDPARFRLEEHEVGVQRRQGQPDPGGGGLEEGRRRHPGQGRQEAQVRLPDLDQRAAPEDPGDRQAGAARRPASSSSSSR